MEYLSPEGLRVDGRRPEELRQIKCQLGVLKRADGSAYYEQGNTKALATVYGPREMDRGTSVLHNRAIVRCEYSMASFSTGERKKRTKGDRRSTEISLVIRQTFESVICTHLFPRSQIDIYIQILQADGGTRCAAINAATLALIDAGIPMKDFVVSCAAGFIDGTPILDLNYVEDAAGGPDLPLAILPQFGKVTMLQMDSKIPIDMFEKVVELAVNGCDVIYQVLKEEVERYTATMLQTRHLPTVAAQDD